MPRYHLQVTPEHPDGRFNTDSFDHLLQRGVAAPGLSPDHRHTLVDAQVSDDGSHAMLTVETEPVHQTRQLRGAFRMVHGTPTAKVVCLLHEDPSVELHRVQLDAPLQAGQRVALGEQEYLVTGTDYPLRDPETGVCRGDVDWQHAYLTPVEPVSAFPQLATAAIYDDGDKSALRRFPPALPPAAG